MHAGCAKVYILARSERPLLEAAQALRELKTPNRHPEAEIVPVTCDVGSAEDIERAAAKVSETTDHVDILVANAGATFIGSLEEHTAAGFGRVMDINVTGVFFSVQKFTPLLTAAATTRDPSRVILISSVAGVVIGDVGSAATYAYATSKAAVIHLMHNLAVELGPRHVNVNVVAPGTIPSKMSMPLLDRFGGPDAYAAQIPDQKLGDKEDVAGTLVFLCSRAAKHMNGATLVLDGGSFLVRGCP